MKRIILALALAPLASESAVICWLLASRDPVNAIGVLTNMSDHTRRPPKSVWERDRALTLPELSNVQDSVVPVA